jgi:hypothetical protein
MVLKRLAVIVAAVGVTIGLNVTPASARTYVSAFESVDTQKCLDYRSDWGYPYLTDCNWGNYQRWYWTSGITYTALRQQATGLCLTARNGRSEMKPCRADDAAAYWSVQDSPAGMLIKNSVTKTCLARDQYDWAKLTTCTGGPSQRWTMWELF